MGDEHMINRQTNKSCLSVSVAASGVCDITSWACEAPYGFSWVRKACWLQRCCHGNGRTADPFWELWVILSRCGQCRQSLLLLLGQEVMS